ncbi:hypothetical protein EVAR_88016_1 [Eumeta japonica]|uniref:Uncharacterized protein n=1 Tax=Eumeta variegata TaxID=151549 RepID=A0A4C1VCD0_EUMVA|nr:hypothetical protein EVAR_88016_1 [Eumeta japonica]
MPNNKILTTQARKMVYDVNCFIKKETDAIVGKMQLVKNSTREATIALDKNLETAICSLHQIKNRVISVADKSSLSTICSNLERIQKETVEYNRKNEDEIQGIINNLKQNQKRTAVATNTSVTTVRRISTLANSSDSSDVFETPGRKRRRSKPITGIDTYKQDVIRECIQNFHITNKELPTIQNLKRKLQEDIDFQGSESSLRRIIKELGFRWKKKKIE